MSEMLLDELLNLEYQGLSDQAAADAINAKMVTIRVLVDLWQIEEYARRNGIRQALKRAENNPQHPCQGIAIDILAYITSPRTKKLNVDLPETQVMFAAMVSCAFASETHVGKMMDLANETKRWVELNSIGNQSADSIRVARDIINGATAKRDGWKQVITDHYNKKYAIIDSWKFGDPDLIL